MATCPVCHVEFNQNDKCPLCGLPAADIRGTSGAYPDFDHADRDNGTTSLGFRLNMWGAISILSLAPLFLLLSIDIIFTKTVSWSLYSSCILLSMWLFGTAIFFLRRLPFFLIMAGFIISFLMLFFIDLFSAGLCWFFPLALPLLVSLYFIIAMITVLCILAKRIGFNLVAFILYGIMLFCIVCDITVGLFSGYPFGISWSVVIFAALLPTGGFFIYLHYILKKSIVLKKIFHL